ncbi:2957_t:CDS:2 [Funneliformis geosporum]|nr:2957_t:CDS:2 [Funneliformis geosporum]
MTNRQELKEKIIRELLPKLSVDPYGGYVDAEELSKKTYDSVEDFYFRVGGNPANEPKSVAIDPERILTKEDYKEIKRTLNKFQKSKELKKQLLSSLSEWDARGVGKILADKEQFTEMDYQELKQEVIKDIKASLKK